MMLDNALIFSSGQDLTATAVSTNVLDMGVARDLGAGEGLWLLIQFGDVVSNATFVADLKGADDEGMSTNVVTKVTNTAITPTDYTLFARKIHPGVAKRYWRLDYTLSGGSSPHIPVTAGLVKDVEVKFHSKSYL